MGRRDRVTVKQESTVTPGIGQLVGLLLASPSNESFQAATAQCPHLPFCPLSVFRHRFSTIVEKGERERDRETVKQNVRKETRKPREETIRGGTGLRG